MNRAEFDRLVYDVVAGIPAGRVITYGRIAVLIGAPRCPRHVGRAMYHAPQGLPCHRVVGGRGNLVEGWPEQRTLLEREGVVFKPNGCVDLKQCLWI
ncbi:MGMT family protein [Feifania hominis]|uniref:Methylated-DNA--[protein]-cysteine S-methyltransferase n=1 Tax=Feifania hominis TaxID=2763660 RepID=A0A926HTF8_9FIRM|nr:methylated-DNA--[protein]-cysteine S-methyltransferase [Feifania hominis]MBC8535263.1 methylated-DNA--[protein]-cysteine S-methyltransferase [Feifania hominis]